MVKIFGLYIMTKHDIWEMEERYAEARRVGNAVRHRVGVIGTRNAELRARNAELRERNAELIEIVDKRNLTIVEMDKQIATLEKQLQAVYGSALKRRTAEAGRALIDAAYDVPEGCVHAFVPGKSGTQEGGAQA